MINKLTGYCLAALCLAGATAVFAQTGATGAMPAGQDPAADLLKQAQQMVRDGKHEDALNVLREASAKAAPSSPSFVAANVQSGVVLDLLGRYEDARGYFSKAIAAASQPEDKARATRAMAMSYAFERNCDGAARYEVPLYESYLGANDFFNAGEIANELARVCLESGNTDQAATWYRRGYESGLREPNIAAARRDLWEFRWEHAQARIAARRGQKAEAQKHVAAARAVFDKGTNPEQAPFVPYLVGYVAFYAGDYPGAITELLKGNQNDPFILSLLAQAHEKSGNKDKAEEYYRKVLTSNAHNPTNAFARPLAKEKLRMR